MAETTSPPQTQSTPVPVPPSGPTPDPTQSTPPPNHIQATPDPEPQPSSLHHDSQDDTDEERVVPGIKKNAFVHKLYTMLSDPKLNHLIWWNENSEFNNTFLLSPGKEFSKVLTNYFKHGNVASFVRQLHMYGFHKVNDTHSSIHGGAGSGSSAGGSSAGGTENQLWEFKHSSGKFRKNDEESLIYIKRRSSSNGSKSHQNYNTSNPPNDNVYYPMYYYNDYMIPVNYMPYAVYDQHGQPPVQQVQPVHPVHGAMAMHYPPYMHMAHPSSMQGAPHPPSMQSASHHLSNQAHLQPNPAHMQSNPSHLSNPSHMQPNPSHIQPHMHQLHQVQHYQLPGTQAGAHSSSQTGTQTSSQTSGGSETGVSGLNRSLKEPVPQRPSTSPSPWNGHRLSNTSPTTIVHRPSNTSPTTVIHPSPHTGVPSPLNVQQYNPLQFRKIWNNTNPKQRNPSLMFDPLAPVPPQGVPGAAGPGAGTTGAGAGTPSVGTPGPPAPHGTGPGTGTPAPAGTGEMAGPSIPVPRAEFPRSIPNGSRPSSGSIPSIDKFRPSLVEFHKFQDSVSTSSSIFSTSSSISSLASNRESSLDKISVTGLGLSKNSWSAGAGAGTFAGTSAVAGTSAATGAATSISGSTSGTSGTTSGHSANGIPSLSGIIELPLETKSLTPVSSPIIRSQSSNEKRVSINSLLDDGKRRKLSS